MSSIFSYDPSPPHPASPWEANSLGGNTPLGSDAESCHSSLSKSVVISPGKTDSEGIRRCKNGLVGVKGLISEPQAGATEYKLHLLREGKTSTRLEQLTTQLLWRLQQSNPYVPPLKFHYY